ncbi:hypothetical protein [Tranquillimonas alkanivorans]|uniref:Uncharacterized protein n=1 Tax=Tranquillimonas alkanivorans TaxID=441119 RepID=A0A1I5NZP5_9RHOB|nr:hypothetical protein [Tranquillimonas alkanivorans]SFP27070.1 hypothetical protein SAMN04488047_104154 [Tranquillimonas alkanivorans]
MTERDVAVRLVLPCTHQFVGARGPRVGEALCGASALDLSDGTVAFGSLRAAGVLRMEPHVRAAGTRIPAKDWQLVRRRRVQGGAAAVSFSVVAAGSRPSLRRYVGAGHCAAA